MAQRYEMQSSWDGQWVKVEDVIKDIEDEPEYPGEMPPELVELFQEIIENKDIDAIRQTLRIAVQQTKSNIIARINNQQ